MSTDHQTALIEGHESIRDAYRDEAVAREYVERRFIEPLGAIAHARQVAKLHAVAAECNPARVMELAPGPARLTVDVAPAIRGRLTLVDASPQMLAQARARLRHAGVENCRLVQGDAFELPFEQQFDLAYSFRLIRHFDTADRIRLYAQLARVLRPGGVLVFDAVNRVESERIRTDGSRQHFDALLTAAEIERELAEAGFSHVQFDGVQHRYGALYQLQVLVAPRSRRLARAAMEIVDRAPGGQPLEWIVTCRRNG